MRYMATLLSNEQFLGSAFWLLRAVSGVCLVFTLGAIFVALLKAPPEPKPPRRQPPVRRQLLALTYVLLNMPIVFRRRPKYSTTMSIGTIAGFSLTHWLIIQLGVTPKNHWPIIWYGLMLFALFLLLFYASCHMESEWYFGRDFVEELKAFYDLDREEEAEHEASQDGESADAPSPPVS